MIDINIVRQNPDLVKQALKNRQKDGGLLDGVIEKDNQFRKILSEVEEIRAEQNALNRSFKGKPNEEQIETAGEIKEKLKTKEQELKEAEKQLNETLEEIPNIPADDVPIGRDDKDNVVIKTVGKPREFDFEPLDHVDLGERLDIIDVKTAGKVSGSRFGYYKNEAALLEMALMFWAFKKLTEKGWKGMVPPTMIKSATEWKCGYASNKNLFNAYYSIPEDDLIFISSSEHSVVPYHMDQILEEKDLPIKYVNFSPCFRREAGTYGKDTRGLFRVHFFNKVEMNVFSLPEIEVSDKLCQEMLALEEELMQDLGIPYQVMKCCTGDLPQPNRRMFDINAWFPGQKAYRETQSCSNCTDYQARRLNTRVKRNGKNELVHILNATLVTDRTLLAILENYQNTDGSVDIPKVLAPYFGKEKIEAKTK
ncbi:MAG: serine--tRNA ligase [Candidatus Shapirobacteria bacterium]|jgi:seryl-tRNA synthetase